ncbi:AraC family transcriptional regulator [Burkholderia perseverans]|uniref:AraC family transcriptional regulator n=1 Tax=Burkholderia perseverans TaxID=2615214 RepID=UPI001FEFC95A|nr:AraC family transcriptional regulator [Burkholderia perseverans]
MVPPDALSQLLLLHPVRTALDTRCLLHAPQRMAHPATDAQVAPYHLVVAGAARVEIDGRAPLALRAGDAVVFPRGHAHRFSVLERDGQTPMAGAPFATDATADILCGQFHFDAAHSRTLIDALPDVVLVRTAGLAEFEAFQSLVRLLLEETGEPGLGANAVVSHLASALLLRLLRAWLKQAGALPGLFSLLADRKLNHALHAMLAEPGRAWTLEQLAQVSGMSRTTFVRTFRAKAGTTPANLLLSIRMAQAAQWLKQSHRSVGEIGERVGYQLEAAFNRAFSRCHGVGPGRFRRGP